MNQSADHDDDAELQSQLADYYRWVEPDRGIRIYVNFETADRLQVQVLRGVTDGRVEVGGILLGRTALDGGRITAVIEDFEAVPCAYSNGPVYSLTAADEVKFKTALAQCKSDVSSGLSPVGYYRSHRRDDLYLSFDDLTLVQRFFPGIDNVFLLIKPLPMRACTAGFFFWEDGKIQSEFTIEVPFAPVKSSSPTRDEPDTIDDLLPPAPLDSSADSTAILPWAEFAPPRRERWYARPRDVAAVTLGIALSFGIFGTVRRSKVSTPAPVAQDLRNGVEPGQIPVLTPSREVETAPVNTPNRQAVIPPQTLQKRASKQEFHRPAVSGIVDGSAPVLSTIPTEADSKLEPPPALVSETKITELPVTPTAINPPPIQNAAPVEVSPPRVEPVTPAPPSSAQPTAESGATPQASKTSFVGPQIMYRVNPTVPPDVRPLITGEIQIDVTVRVDSAGKVTDAQVTSSRGAAARLVAAEAIKAARLFRFRPARENDQAVQSRMVLTFRFRKAGE